MSGVYSHTGGKQLSNTHRKKRKETRGKALVIFFFGILRRTQ